ncbi:MAG: ATP-binding protein [Actinobacteria bacterium]|nr:MAG: ATP-binding protein [Actinomycetota bacterium]
MPTEPDLAISLRLDAHAPRAARCYVARVDRPSPDLRDAVMLITNELVTRALRQRHFTSGEDIELRVWMPADVVRVEIQGPRNLLPPPGAPDEPHDGLLIEKLADRWSMDTHERRACAWFEIDRHKLNVVPVP